MTKNILIIAASGGGGLIQAANAKKQELSEKYPGCKIVYRDVLLDWIGKPIGPWAVKKWNKWQKKGDIKSLERLLSKQWLADILFWPQIFIRTLKILFREEVDIVVDSQNVGTSAILSALRIYNTKRNKNVFLEKVIVDLPTKLNTHYFKPIKKIKEKNKKYLKMITIEPLLEDYQTEEMFWQENCALTLESIVYERFAIRKVFKKYQNSESCKDIFNIEIQTHNAEEEKMSEDLLSKSPLSFKKKKGTFSLTIKPKDILTTILLGSQPAKEATLQYIKGIIDLARKNTTKNYHLFVFASYHEQRTRSLFFEIFSFVKNHPEKPKNLTILPLSFQSESTIAPIFYRSNITFTRSGGQTAMELMCVMHGQMLIHSEAKKKTDRKSLLKGMFAWEAGSAMYLEEKRGAKIVTPHSFKEHIQSYFSAE
jgi:hypothetical protein